MSKNRKSDHELTASQLMTQNVVTVSQHLPASEATELLLAKAISGVPVVNDQGRCIGIFSAADFARIVNALSEPHSAPAACPFQVRHRRADGSEGTICTLPVGLCPLQRPEDDDGRHSNLCGYPHEIVVEWQALQPPRSPTDPVEKWMTAPAITIRSTATIQECAAKMSNARIHRLIVVDEEDRVLGLISSLDLLKAVADPASFHITN